MSAVRYEPVEFVDVTPRSDGQGGRQADAVSVYRTRAKIGIVKEKRNWVTGQVIMPQSFTVTFYARAAYEPTADTTVRFRGSDYTIQSKNWVDMSRREIVLTVLGNGQSNSTG